MLAAAILLLAAGAWAQEAMTLSVGQLTGLVKSSLQLHHPDKKIAEYLKHVTLSQKLDDRTIEELQGMGAGPKTVAALRELRDSSAKLAAAPPPPPKPAPLPQRPPPDSIDQKKILDEVRDYALHYSDQLPNFICVEVTRRYYDNSGMAGESNSEYWRQYSRVVAQLNYFEHHEDYKLTMVNDHAVTGDESLDRLGGVVSRGEFGTMMYDIFKPQSQARFEWDHWGTLRGRPVYVFAYDIDQAHSEYQIVADRSEELVPAYRGLVYADRDTKMILRVVQQPYDIPTTFPIQAVKTILDYDFQKIGDGEYLLPLKAVITSRSAKLLTKNEKEFRLYRKFGAEAVIKSVDIDNLPPIPEDKTTEQKPAPPPAAH